MSIFLAEVLERFCGRLRRLARAHPPAAAIGNRGNGSGPRGRCVRKLVGKALGAAFKEIPGGGGGNRLEIAARLRAALQEEKPVGMRAGLGGCLAELPTGQFE